MNIAKYAYPSTHACWERANETDVMRFGTPNDPPIKTPCFAAHCLLVYAYSVGLTLFDFVFRC